MADNMQKRINRCRYSHISIRPPHVRKCCKDISDMAEAVPTTEEKCEKCPHFSSRYIEYPITVNGIDYEPRSDYSLDKPGLVKIRPCGEKYGGKTYLGLLFGDMPVSTTVSYDRDTKRLNVGMMNNPAIFVFETKEVVYGCESWWGRIDDPSELKDITDDTIDSQWYVAALKAMTRDNDDHTDVMTQDNSDGTKKQTGNQS